MNERPTRIPGPRIAPNGDRFAWGPVQAVHTVGEYDIVEYLDDRSNFGREVEWAPHGQTMFHPYINGRDTHRSYRTLDSALVGVIAHKREGPNGQAAEYFDRMTEAGR